MQRGFMVEICGFEPQTPCVQGAIRHDTSVSVCSHSATLRDFRDFECIHFASDSQLFVAMLVAV